MSTTRKIGTLPGFGQSESAAPNSTSVPRVRACVQMDIATLRNRLLFFATGPLSLGDEHCPMFQHIRTKVHAWPETLACGRLSLYCLSELALNR